MKPITLTNIEAKTLLASAIFGLLIPNGVFCYYFITDSEVTKAALRNPISLVLLIEAFFLMFLFAWLLKKLEVKKPSGRVFILMSLVGSMVFSVPAALYLLLKAPPKQ